MTPKLLAEAIGTFFLVLAIGLGGFYGDGLTAVAIGFTLMVMVYAGGHISGAHYNPAITLAAWIRGKLPAGEIAPYWAAQFAGALVASFLVYKFRGSVIWVGPGEGVSLIKVIVGEITWTFALAYVILNVATAKATAGNSYYGLAIGGTVLAGAIAMGPVTGGAFNPAVGVAPALFAMVVGHEVPPEWWTYLVAPPLGAAAAALLFKRMNPSDT
jgi:aquaporin Z